MAKKPVKKKAAKRERMFRRDIPPTRFYDPLADAGMVFLTGQQAKAAALAIAAQLKTAGSDTHMHLRLSGALARLEATFELPTFRKVF